MIHVPHGNTSQLEEQCQRIGSWELPENLQPLKLALNIVLALCQILRGSR